MHKHKHSLDASGIVDAVDIYGGGGDDGDGGESVYWLLEYWSWRSAGACFDPAAACSRSDLGGRRGLATLPSTLLLILLLPRGHISK